MHPSWPTLPLLPLAPIHSFEPLIGDALAVPSAVLGLIEDTQLDQRYVWTVESPTVWRVRRENGTDATRYELDDQRRIVTRTWENGAQPEPVDVWTYDDEGRLIATPSGTTFKYDRGGNIVEVDGFPRKVFDYSCW